MSLEPIVKSVDEGADYLKFINILSEKISDLEITPSEIALGSAIS